MYKILFFAMMIIMASCKSPFKSLQKRGDIPNQCIEAYRLFKDYLELKEDGFLYYKKGLVNPNKSITDLFFNNMECWTSYLNEEEILEIFGIPKVIIEKDNKQAMYIYRVKTPECDSSSEWEKDCGVFGLALNSNRKLSSGAKFYLPD